VKIDNFHYTKYEIILKAIPTNRTRGACGKRKQKWKVIFLV